VCDKGVGAALFMVVFTSLIRAFSESWNDTQDCDTLLKNIVSNINDYIATTHDSSNMFATVFFGILEPSTKTLHFINAGHELPLIVDAKGVLKTKLETTGPAIGLMPDMEFAANQIIFDPGDILVAYTDGVIDARNAKDVSFTEESLVSHISQSFTSSFSLLKYVENQINRHIQKAPQFDDIAMIALRYKTSLDDEKHEFVLRATLKNLPILREFVEQASIHMRMDDNMTSAFKLAVDEACTNIITHGYKGMKPGPIKLTLEREYNKIKLAIYDEGKTFDPDDAEAADIESDWEERKIGGLGLFLIREMVDDIHYKSGPDKGNLLILTKKLNLRL
jgi:anti-sigma regulatory factor (Ser/Thr protein kinase)